jgi:putative sporulation protein YtxC
VESIAIGTAQNLESVRSRLSGELRLLEEEEGIKITIAERTKGHLTFLGCNVETGDSTVGSPKEIFRYYIARALADLIVNEMTEDMLPKILHRNYAQFGDDERTEILAKARGLLEVPESDDGKGLIRQINRRNQILFRILEYLDLHDELVVEGFLRFRLKEYFRELVETIDKAVDAFMVDREYREFIRLLKYFVEIQEPRHDEVHVVTRPTGAYRLIDREHRIIENDYLEGFIGDVVHNEVDCDDLLVSALITIAPRRVVLHFHDHKRVTDTINSVFEGRVDVCPGCVLCSTEALPVGSGLDHSGRPARHE